MYSVFLMLFQVVNYISFATMILLCCITIFYFIRNAEMGSVEACCKYLKQCRWASVIFILCAWLSVSAESTAGMLRTYEEIAKVCQRMGAVWILMGFGNMVISIIISVINRNRAKGAATAVLNAIRTPSFVTGGILLLLSLLLTTNPI